MNKSGYLELIIGPMYAGKSTELLKIINRYKCLNKNIVVVNHILNNRYGSNNLTTHNKEKYESCVILTVLGNLKENPKNNFDKIDVIIIEELQFFPDAYDLIIDWCDNYQKIIIVAGLDGDYMRNPFGDVLRLIPHSDKVTKLNALCKSCGDGTLAHFTKRKTKNNELTLIGSDSIYEAVCRYHYLLTDE